jgi:hypothetical protein
MARCKNSPESLRAKTALADRLREIRTEKYGERGGPELSRRLNLPIRTWYNYEVGVTVPAEVLLRFVELTGAEPLWLLRGIGPKYREAGHAGISTEPETDSVTALLRRALQMLDERREPAFYADGDRVLSTIPGGAGDSENTLLVRIRLAGTEWENRLPEYLPVQRDWVEGQQDCRCVRHAGDSMEPILSDGALVGFSARAEAPELLDNALVVYQHEGEHLVRWLQLAGRFAVLRPENPSEEAPILPVDLEAGTGPTPTFRRVLWSCTPHGSFSEPESDSDWLKA